MVVRPGSIIYQYQGTPPALGDVGATWTFSPKPTVDPARVRRLADAFGVTGDVKQMPADQGGGFSVGPQDGSSANLAVIGDAPMSWYYNPMMRFGTATDSCAGTATGVVGGKSLPITAPQSAGPPESAAGAPTEVSAAGATPIAPGPPVASRCDTGCIDAVGTVTSDPIGGCGSPQPPAGVPTKEEAIARARVLFATAGIDVSSSVVSGYADAWSASVTAAIALNGHPTQLSTTISFGGGGQVVGASGMLAKPVPGPDYPIVGVVAALKRLNEQGSLWMTSYGGFPAKGVIVPGGAAGSVSGGTATAQVSPPANPPAVPVTAIPIPLRSLPAEPVAPASLPEPITITLTGVRLDLGEVYAADGTIWLLPTYVFTSTEGGEYSVIGVADEFVQRDEPNVEVPPVGSVAVGTTPAGGPTPQTAPGPLPEATPEPTAPGPLPEATPAPPPPVNS
jgi:hypothetical protein